ncbi:MAG: mechanosensitive ion channel family protein [Methanomassiliicoccus sp.]|nr:mechanosensitive ion channel family protein [Methanomassiliicoccus sp.]
MRKSLALMFLPVMMVALLLVPSAAGAGVNVLELNEGYTKIDNASESVSFTWVVFNNDTVPYLVQVDAREGGDASGVVPPDITLGVTQDLSALNPGESREIVLNVSASRTSRSDVFPVFVNMTFTRMDDPSQVQTASKTVTVQVEALFETSGNKIFGIWENNLPSPLNTLVGTFVITVLLWALLAGFIYFVIDPIVSLVTKRTKTELDDRIMEETRMPVFILIVLFGLVDSLTILDISPDWYVTIIQAYQVVMVVVLAYMAYRIFDRVIIAYAEKWSSKTDTEVDDVLVPLLHKVGIVLIPVVGLVTVLSIMGIDVTLLVASVGVIGLVIAFAVQETLGNLFAGMQLLVDRPFRVGDIVELDSGEVCEVKRIGLRSTTMLNAGDNEMVVVPNNDVVNKKVVNYSRPDSRRYMSCEVGVAYGSDLKRVEDILLDVADGHPDIIKREGQKPYVRVVRFNDSSVDFALWYMVDLNKRGQVASEIRRMVYDRFNQEGIEIPFPQREISLKNGGKD